MRTALVQGASRGLGFGLARKLLSVHSVGRVFATCRDPQK
jgi:NAD(P)-dependent dehydrogenase (short-subunit alcohol dehydrogenase family)